MGPNMLYIVMEKEIPDSTSTARTCRWKACKERQLWANNSLQTRNPYRLIEWLEACSRRPYLALGVNSLEHGGILEHIWYYDEPAKRNNWISTAPADARRMWPDGTQAHSEKADMPLWCPALWYQSVQAEQRCLLCPKFCSTHAHTPFADCHWT